MRASIRGAGAARGAPAEQEAKQMLIAREGGRAACAVGNSGHHPCHDWIPVRSLEARGSGRRYASAQGPASRLPSGPVGAKGTKVLALNGKEAFGHVLGLRLGIDFHAFGLACYRSHTKMYPACFCGCREIRYRPPKVLVGSCFQLRRRLGSLGQHLGLHAWHSYL